MNKTKLLTILALTIPVKAFAAPTTFKGLVELLLGFLGLLTPILFSTALLVFLWGVGKFILNSDSSNARESGKNTMIWGVVALFVLFSLWGIVNFLGDSLGISSYF